MPDTPIAAPVAAPAAAAPAASAPVSAPVSTPAAEPAAAVPVSTPAVEAPAAPAAEVPAAKPDAPKRSDFPDTAEGIEQFLKANNAFEESNPDGTQFVTGDEVIDPDAAAPEAKAPEDAEKPADEKPADADKPAEADVPTPEGLSKLMEDHPEFKQAIEAAPPAVKGALYAMARQNAKLAPIGEIFPNVEAAKFAQTNANEFVSLKTAFTLSDSPEKMADAAGMFLDQFKMVDDKGEPILDAKGNPTYGDDLELFTNHLTTRNISTRIDILKEKIEAGNFTTEEGRDNAEQALSALEFGLAYLNAEDPDALDKPNLDGLTPEQKAWQEREQKKIDEQKEKLGLKDKELTKRQVTEKRAQYDTKYREQFGGSTGKYLSNYLKAKEEAGVAIPRYLLTMTDPKTGVSVFAQQAFQKLNQKLDKLPNVKAHSATLQMNATNDDALAARVTYGQSLIDEHLPAIIDDLLKEAGVSMADDAKNKIASRDARRSDARTEPAAGTPASPKHMTDQQLMKEAYKNVDAKYPNIDPAARLEKALQEKNRLESAA